MGNVTATAQHHRRASHACHLPGKGSKFKSRLYWMHIAFASRLSKKVIKSNHPKLGMVCMPNTHTSHQLKESKWRAQPYCRNILCSFPTVARVLQTCPPRMWISFLFLPPRHQGLMPGSDTLASCLGRLTFSSVADLFVAYVICTSHVVQQGILVKVETQNVRIESF